MEAQAWVGKCEGCGLFCVLYEEVEFVCGKCHGEINPGNAISAAVDQALTTLFAEQLPTKQVLAAIWYAPRAPESTMRIVDAGAQYPDPREAATAELLAVVRAVAAWEEGTGRADLLEALEEYDRALASGGGQS